MPGAILLVSTPRREYLAAIGMADLKRAVPMRPNHLFQIASVTKSFVGVLAAQLHAEGKLNLDAPITNWLDTEITEHVTHADKMTLRQLLEHTSGFHEPRNDHWYPLKRHFVSRHGEWSAMTELKFAFDRPPAFAPGKGWEYCNAGYMLAGLIIDQVAGHHHSVEIRNRILEPLGLANTFYELTEEPRGERAHGYEDYFNCWRMDATWWTPATGGHAGLSSSVADLAKYVRAIARTGDFVSEQERRQLFWQWSNDSKTYFLGLQRVRPCEDTPWFIGHNGGTPGYHSFAFHEPGRDLTVVYFGSSTFMKASRGPRKLDAFYITFRDALLKLVLAEAS